MGDTTLSCIWKSFGPRAPAAAAAAVAVAAAAAGPDGAIGARFGGGCGDGRGPLRDGCGDVALAAAADDDGDDWAAQWL